MIFQYCGAYGTMIGRVTQKIDEKGTVQIHDGKEQLSITGEEELLSAMEVRKKLGGKEIITIQAGKYYQIQGQVIVKEGEGVTLECLDVEIMPDCDDTSLVGDANRL